MKKIKRLLIFALLLMTIFCVANCETATAQIVRQEQIEIVERLADGSIILTIDGVKYRAITADQIRQIQEMRVNLQSATTENKVLREQNQTLNLALQLAKQNEEYAASQLKLAKDRGDEYKKLFEDERALRQQAEKLPKSKNLFEKILSHPVTQVVTVVVVGTIAATKK